MRWRTYSALFLGVALLAGLPAAAEGAVRATCALAAHRGDWSADQTENGIPAMRRAITLGADYLETDVRVTKDKKLVLMHDARVDRTTNGRGYVGRMTLRQIKALRLDDGSKVPTLNDLTYMARRSGVHLLVEMKAMGDRKTYVRLQRKVKEFGIKRVRVTSFSAARLQTLERIAPRIRKGIITKKRLTPRQVKPYDSVLIRFDRLSAGWLDSMPYPVFAWTLNDEERWSASHAYRLAGVITDAPADFLPWRKRNCR